MARVKEELYVPKEHRETLKCIDCENELPISEFQKQGTTSAGTRKYCSRCKNCFKIYAVTKNYDKRKNFINEAKKECCVCGYIRYKGALEFHHTKPETKLFEIADTVYKKRKSVTDEMLEEEIKKCVVLCSNCHREYHAGMIEIEKFKQS